MHHIGKLATAALVACLFICGNTKLRALNQEDDASKAKTPAADNTKANKRDRAKSEPTADQGKNSATDREIMQKIRRALMEDDSLSTYAHNVKVISQDGKVTLKGPVRSEEEKKTVEAKATEVAGAENVTNKLTVKSKKSRETKK